MNATHMLLVSADLSSKDVKHMSEEMKKVPGISWILGLNAVKGAALPEEMVPDELKEALSNENWQLLLVGSKYKVASEEVNVQCDELDKICKSYDAKGMLVGEAPCTKDLIRITDKDFKTVSVVSIGVIFIKYGNPFLYGNSHSFYRLGGDRHNTTWCNGRLCNIDDDQIPEGTGCRGRKKGSGGYCLPDQRKIHCSQRLDIFCCNFWGRLVFQH